MDSVKSIKLNAAYYLERAVLNSSIKNYNQSLADYDKAISLDTNNIVGYFSRANTRFKLLTLIHSFDKETTQISLNGNASGKAQKSVYDPSYDLVINDYSKALKLDPNFTFAYFNRAAVKISLGDFPAALSDLSKSLGSEPDFPEAFYNEGLVLIFMEQREKGCIDLSKAGELGMKEAYNVMKRYCN